VTSVLFHPFALGEGDAEALMEGGMTTTVNNTPLLANPLAVTTTLPVVAPLGTGTTIEDALQLVGVATVPLKLTVPWVAPKFVPLIVIDAPKEPEAGETLVIDGLGITVNGTPLLTCPLTATSTLPVVAPLGTGVTIEVVLQLVGVAAVPLKLIVLEL